MQFIAAKFKKFKKYGDMLILPKKSKHDDNQIMETTFGAAKFKPLKKDGSGILIHQKN